jgi:16S rRNA (cytosine1402-N4)-methyltransferase
MVDEVLEYLVGPCLSANQSLPNGSQTGQRPEDRWFVDGTVGQGGHAGAVLAALPGCRLLGFDRDARNLAVARANLTPYIDRVTLVEESYVNLLPQAYVHAVTQVDGILLDLGFSSAHVDDPDRGFSFQADGPLDMRYDQRSGLSASELVNESSEDELARILRVYGEEPNARRIARALVEIRENQPIVTTHDLVNAVETVVRRHGPVHPATRTFQAIRIAVNDELGGLEQVLPDAVSLLKPGGRLAIISFHSLEDRIVKQFFKTEEQKHTLKILTKKVLVPSVEEVRRNPRSRSAKLRVAQRT